MWAIAGQLVVLFFKYLMERDIEERRHKKDLMKEKNEALKDVSVSRVNAVIGKLRKK